ncbi:NB-ARC domain-containing protein [Actinoplanes solisilvae]|uniref:NB-ARC domain-containing protein n=1 Tax=Actinoplanes solisilvae TaxID=2486853 RepID=UPI000FD92711|nr:NB-ARC domain-containing protein [Actinoplanes solisilvae]
MSVSSFSQRRPRLPRPGWLAALLTLTASTAAGLISVGPNATPAAAVLTGVAAALSAGIGARAVAARRRSHTGRSAESPAAQWKSYTETLVQPVPAQLPPSNSTFRGRATELANLQERHERWRDRQRAGQAGAPVVIFLHGMAGIGKTAVAQTLAHAIKSGYPDGQLYSNLGVAGTARPPGQVLHSFLSALGWDVELIPDSTAERAWLFRVLTRGKRMLIVLDAARDQAQLRELMPSESRCTVVVTSRRDLSPAFGARSLQIGPLTPDDGLDLLAAALAQGPDFDLGAATEIVDACGAHPLALRAAADLAMQGQHSLPGLAARLQEPGGLQTVLYAPSRDLHDRLSGEYRQLSTDHQKAFRLLAFVSSRTFVPWVLRPASEVELPEAENLLADLASAQLVLAAGRDEVTAIDRYELPPITRQLAASLAEPADDATGAGLRLDEAYLEAAERVIRELDPDFAVGRPDITDRWLPQDALFATRVANQGQAKAWVREEYSNLLRVIRLARERSDHALSARIASWLGGCMPRGVAVRDVLDGFTRGIDSAHQVSEAAVIDVLLARGAYWTALEQYGAAFDDFAEALSRCHTGRFATRRVTVERRCGEAYLRAGEHGAAARRLARAEELAGQLPRGEQMLPLIRTLRFLADPEVRAPAPIGQVPPDDELGYWTALARSDEAVTIANDWATAETFLSEAARDYHGDLRRAATIGYWQSRLYLARFHRKTGDVADVRRAVRSGHRSLHDHHQLGDVAGQIRVRCILVGAYLAAGRPDTAANQLEAARRQRSHVDPWLTRPGNPLDAVLRRAHAETRLQGGQRQQAMDDLRTAATVLAAHDDHRAVAEIAALTNNHVEELLDAAEPEILSATAVRAYLDREIPTTVGQAATLRVEVSAAHLLRYQGAVTNDTITVLVCSADADVRPMGVTIDLGRLDGDVHLVHEIRPRRAGRVQVKVQLYAPADGVLLQEFTTGLPPVARAQQDAA